MQDASRIPELLEHLYDAALGLCPWSDPLKLIAKISNSRSAGFFTFARGTREIFEFHAFNIPDDGIEHYARHYVHVDPRVDYLFGAQIGTVVSDYDFITEREIDKNEYYSDFLGPRDFRYFAAVGFDTGPDIVGTLTLQRSQSDGHVGTQQVNLMRILAPHVGRASHIKERFGLDRSLGGASIDALDHLSVGVVIVSEEAKVLHVNRYATRILARRDSMEIVNGHLRTISHQDNGALYRQIHLAVTDQTKPDLVQHDLVAVRRSNSKQPYLALALAAHTPRTCRLTESSLSKAAALIFLFDPDHMATSPDKWLNQVYKLTPAETRLVGALASGKSSSDYASAAKLSINTVRWTLKQILAKTDCRRQSDLIKLVTKMSCSLPTDGEVS